MPRGKGTYGHQVGKPPKKKAYEGVEKNKKKEA